ncbi:uncharacterized protein LOC111297914 isoform X2 [Durio zibethinus]|uniref:Uncharacterized protein LOC111297914 isoform X2 n=1 Tax=Durio zibethinus TaxID=66656 RepID=A0A6P5Z799_DURZI|nr:uncharacterized protein LOC111297914 isoform X2 [Durio zibethinus]
MAPKTRSRKDNKCTQNDNNDGHSSYFQKTVCLHDWWLVKADKDFEGKRLAIAGSTSREFKAVRLFTSAPIVKRYDVFTLETADRICVCIKGFINRQRTHENGFSSEVFTHFYFGFPPYWEEYAKKCLGENLTSDIELEVVPNSSESASDPDPSLISTPSKHKEVFSQDKRVQMSCVENASRGSDVLNQAANLSSMVEERSNLDIGVEMDYSELATADVRVLNASNTHNHAANMPRSIEKRITHAPANIETKIVNVNPYTSGNRTTKGRVQITNSSQKKNVEVGCSTMQKDRASTRKVQDEQQLNSSIPRSTQRGSPRKETQRKLDFEKVASSVSPERKQKQSVISPKSLNLKYSRAGRVLLPPLEFWRNQIPVYDQNRTITGIKEEVNAVKPSGSRSQPQKRRKRKS